MYGDFYMSLATGTDSDSYDGSCYSMCNQTRTGRPWDCKDNSCCKMPVPGGYTRILVAAVFNTSDDLENCNYSASAIVDQDSFGSNPGSMFQLQGTSYSMRLDWAIPNNTYSSARLGHISYQCAQNAASEDKGWGYLCKSNGRYMGDGYVNGTGCKEVKKCRGFGCFQTVSIITGACGPHVDEEDNVEFFKGRKILDIISSQILKDNVFQIFYILKYFVMFLIELNIILLLLHP